MMVMMSGVAVHTHTRTRARTCGEHMGKGLWGEVRACNGARRALKAMHPGIDSAAGGKVGMGRGTPQTNL